MRALPDLKVRFKELYNILHGPVRAQLLLTGIDLGVFTILTTPRTAREVAEVLGSHPDNTRYFLDALAASDLVQKRGGVYTNTPEGQQFLVQGEPTYMGELFKLQHQGTNVTLEAMTELVMEGPPERAHEISSDQAWAEMTPIAANYQRSGYAQQISRLVAGLPEFPSFARMLDLGGGAGLVGMAIVGAHPSMSGVLFEQPSVAEVARRFVAEYEMEDRMTVVGGDYMKDDIGGGFDLIWAGATLNFAKDCIDEVISKIHRALRPGGVFVSYHEGLTHERTKPEAILFDMLAERMTNRDWSEDHGWLADGMIRAGFQSVQSRVIEATIGVMDLDIGRKAR